MSYGSRRAILPSLPANKTNVPFFALRQTLKLVLSTLLQVWPPSSVIFVPGVPVERKVLRLIYSTHDWYPIGGVLGYLTAFTWQQYII